MDTNDWMPCVYPMCISVKDKMQNCPEIQRALTKSNLDDIYVYWSGVFLHSVYHHFKDLRANGYENWDNSLLFCGLSAQTMQLDWLIYSACYGQYDLAIRELRNMLESAFLFYRGDTDINIKGKTLSEKAEALENLNPKEKYGKLVFENSQYTKWQQAYDPLYRELCTYTHTSISLDNAKILFEDFNTCSQPVYDKRKALKCISYIQSVLVTECNLMETVLRDTYGLRIGESEYASLFGKIDMQI